MNTQEINEALAALSSLSRQLEDAYIESEGEVTASIEQLEEAKDKLRELLTTEGVDSLGRWLKAKQDEITAAKAEKYAAEQRVRSLQRTEEYIKGEIALILKLTDTDKVKGTYYGFTRTTSTHSAVAQDCLEDVFLPQIQERIGFAFPSWLHIKVSTTVKELRECGGDALDFLDETTTPSVTFNKPRKPKEE